MTKRRSKRQRSVTDIVSTVEEQTGLFLEYPFTCLNCDTLVSGIKLYCSEVCQQTAITVRYARRCERDGRILREDVQEAIHTRVAMILGGGYPAQERRLPESTRQAVIERDQGRCKICGEPGTQIDHIASSSNELDNLQLLCSRCHHQKTAASFVSITPESHPEAWAQAQAIQQRIDAPTPLRLCDSDQWETIWRDLLAKRRQIMKSQATTEDDTNPPHPILEHVDTADLEDLSDGEQAEYLALFEGGGDEAWAADMFGLSGELG